MELQDGLWCLWPGEQLQHPFNWLLPDVSCSQHAGLQNMLDRMTITEMADPRYQEAEVREFSVLFTAAPIFPNSLIRLGKRGLLCYICKNYFNLYDDI